MGLGPTRLHQQRANRLSNSARRVSLASEGSVETPAEKMVAGHSREMSVEVKDRAASKDATVQLIDNVPRKMRVGSLERIEVRIARRQVSDAMTARLWAPDGGWLVSSISPITWTR